MTKYKFDNNNINFSDVHQRLKKGEYPICPRCGQDLLVALDWDTASKANLHPGIYCPNNPSHVYISINIDKDKPFMDETKK